MTVNKKRLRIGIGSDLFREVATTYDIIVDKSLFIKEVIDATDKSMLIIRPRRWGKSLGFNMLKNFLEPESEECKAKLQAQQEIEQAEKLKQSKQLHWQDYFNPRTWHNVFFATPELKQKLDLKFSNLVCNRDLFTGTKFTTEFGEVRELNPMQISIIDSGKYMEYQGQAPVIFLNLSGVSGNSMQRIENSLKFTISKLFGDYTYLWGYLHDIAHGNQANAKDKKEAIKLLQKFDKIYDNNAELATLEELEGSINFLVKLLYMYHGQKVYILIDEYDRAVNSLLQDFFSDKQSPEQESLIKDTANLISKTICSALSKNNPHVEKLILTGILDTTQKEFGSGCNNMQVYGISSSKFSKHFGFSEQEVKAIVDQCNFDDTNKALTNIKSWYNGYLVPISETEYMPVYTPWAVMNYIRDAYDSGSFSPENYWTSSGASTILYSIFQKEACLDSALSHKFQDLISQNEIILEFDQRTSLIKQGIGNPLQNEKMFSYLLLNAGYLTVKKVGEKYHFSIPNLEVRQEFVDVIKFQMALINEDHHKICSKLLDDLHKKQHLEVFKAIKSDNYTAFEMSIQRAENPTLKCSDNSLNFNYFHIASLSKNPQIMQNLLEKCSGNISLLLSAKDKIFGLNSKDYIQLSNSSHIFSSLDVFEGVDESLRVPTAYENVFCDQVVWYAIYSLLVCPSATAAVKFGSKIFTPREISSTMLYVTFVTTGTGVTMVKDTLKVFDQYKLAYCEDYNDYHAINISDPSEFDSLKQCKRYQFDGGQKVHVMLGAQCSKGDDKIRTITAPLFDHDFYGNEELAFTLCAIPSSLLVSQEEI